MARRLWLEDHRETLGLPLALILTAALGATVWFVLDPHYPSQPVTGQITELSVMTQRKSVVSAVKVDVDGRSVLVAVPFNYGCGVGDRIRLRKLGVRWGYSYSAAVTPHSCR